MRELNFAEVAAVSGGESNLYMNLNQSVDSKGLVSTAVNIGKAIGYGGLAELGAKAVDAVLGSLSGGASSTGSTRGGSNGTDGTANNGSDHGF